MPSALITVMSNAIDKVRMPLLRDFGELDRLHVSKKGTADFVTNADIRTERTLVEELTKARKGWGFLTEEDPDIAGDGEFRFVIDPIDGTSNFIHAIPYFCISVAAQQRQADGSWQSIAGIVADIVHDEWFIAERGQGATVNNNKLRVSKRQEALLFATTAPRLIDCDIDALQAGMQHVVFEGVTVRCPGASALDLAYVAAGRYDACWHLRVQEWDIAAGTLLVEEAGGEIAMFNPCEKTGRLRGVLAGTPALTATLKDLVTK
ncbi:MAG: inositol monophosphatase [Rickettsiales bacterium]|nr:inositol monophosphatase [Rickettsiales bacterium]